MEVFHGARARGDMGNGISSISYTSFTPCNLISRGRGSLEETKYHLLLARDLHYLSETDYNKLLDGYNAAGKMLNGLINKVRKEVQGSS